MYLPDIQDVEAEWFENVNIFVEWKHSMDANVRGYHVYINEEMFTSTDEATMVGETAAANSLLITPDLYDGLDNASTYYVAVVPYDDTVAKSTVEAVKVDALVLGEGDDGAGADEGSLSLESLLTTPNLIAAGMLLIIVLLLVLVVRSRSSSKQRSKTWELQEATWGIQDASWDTPGHQHRPPFPHLRPA